MRTWFAGVAVTTAVLLAACGGKMSSPTSPSGMTSTSAPSTTGATVNGTVRLGATAADVGSAADPLRVEVVGANVVATVSGAGQFQLTNVPAGQVKLRFFGAGANATVTLSSPVSTGQTVNITVTVVGNSATIESEMHEGASAGQEIEGRIESLPPTQPAGTLIVAGQTITTNGQTTIRQGSVTKAFTDLQVGQRVHVKGSLIGTSFVASIIEIQNTQTDLPVEINGTVEGLTGPQTGFQFTVNGRLIKGDGQTIFYGNSMFSQLLNGVRVEVKGEQRDAFVYAVRIHVEDATDDGEDDENETELEGTLSGLTGTCPSVSFTLNGKSVSTNGSTMYKGLTCADLASLPKIEVEGQLQSNGTVLATKIEREDTDENGNGSVELSGTPSGLTGTCPSVSFTLSGKSVSTNGSTMYKGLTCSGLASLPKIEVKGQTQMNGTVLATRISKED